MELEQNLQSKTARAAALEAEASMLRTRLATEAAAAADSRQAAERLETVSADLETSLGKREAEILSLKREFATEKERMAEVQL